MEIKCEAICWTRKGYPRCTQTAGLFGQLGIELFVNDVMAFCDEHWEKKAFEWKEISFEEYIHYKVNQEITK